MKKTISLLILILFNLSAKAEVLDEYYNTINKICPSSNVLLIKKSLIEISSEQPCSSLFTSVLLKECPKLTCYYLLENWTSINAKNSGAVVGK